MSDIVKRLRTWTHSVHATPVSDMLDEAADEIGRLRSAYATAIHCLIDNAERLRLTYATQQQDATQSQGSVRGEGIFTLTAAEREAMEWYAAYGAGDHAATLRGLLERLK